jgi:hypothetical protein
MKYYVKHIDNVTNLQTNEYNFCWKQNNILVINNEELENIYTYVLIGNYVVFSRQEDNIEIIYLYNIKNQAIKQIFKNGGLGFKIFGKSLISISNRNSKTKDIFDFENECILIKSKTPINSVFKNHFFLNLNSSLKSLSLLTSEYNWEISLEHFGEIVTVLGVVENTLWIWLTKDQLIGIDVNNGETTSHLFPLQPILKDIIGYVSHKYFIEKEHSLYFFHRSYLIQVNLLDNTTHLLWENQEYEIGLSAFTDDYIYFIGGKNQGVFKNGVGVFDRKTNQVIWETTFELDNYVVLKEIQYCNDKIYVLDTAGILRIYEKEE